MATKYVGQNALNKLMQIIKTALNNKADKTNATTSAAGLMSAADKTKLDGIDTGANKTVVDAELSATSANPVQNKAVKTALDGKADKDILNAPVLTSPVMIRKEGETDPLGVYLSTVGTGEKHAEIMLEDVNENSPVAIANLRTPTGTGSDGYAATKGYVDSKVAEGGVTVDSAISATSTNPVQNKVVKSYVDTKVSGLQTADQVQAAINSAITGVYTPKGSTAFKSLPTAAAGNKGWVYNVSDAFTTTAAFVEGAGHSYGAGTNVVCVDAGSGSYKWDVLAGTIDLTELTADEVQTLWNSI